MRLPRLLVLTVGSLGCALASYVYDFPALLNPYTSSQWTVNGSISAATNMVTSSSAGTLIFQPTVPGTANSYEVRMTLTLLASGGNYDSYLRASSNFNTSPATGSAYYVRIKDPVFSGTACSATLEIGKIVSGTLTVLQDTTVPCANGMVVRSLEDNSGILVYIDNVNYASLGDSAISSGQPGIGVSSAPSGNGISALEIGHLDTNPPGNFTISSSAFRDRVDLQWTTPPDDLGIAWTLVVRDNVLIGGPLLNDTAFSDFTTASNSTYTYEITPTDFHWNGTEVSATVVTPTTVIDPREVGVRPTGSYWGGGGEQIDMRSGNLNYTLPIVKAMGRGSWSVGFQLSYNSQNWRQDTGGIWQIGIDTGYGYGWRLQAGSLAPLYNGLWNLAGYMFTDSTGAEYMLTTNTNGVWTSQEGIYVSYVTSTGRLYFPDGSFWVFGSTSSPTEQDAGTMYPTLMEDSNGNEILITYAPAYRTSIPNTSARISTIEDVRGNGSADYTFTYTYLSAGDEIPHLTGITNRIGTAENYSFTYTPSGPSAYNLTSPFGGQAYGNVNLLQSSTVTGIPLTTYFTYDTASSTSSCTSAGTGTSGPGELTQVTTPYCGHLRWTYAAYTLANTLTYREVQNRYLSMSSGAAETAITLVRGNDSTYNVHSSATLEDTTANAEKIWTFQTSAGFNFGLQLSYKELTLSTNTALSLLNFTWAQTPTSLNPYIGTTVTKLNPGQTYEADKQTVQTLDQYGNLLTQQVYNFGAGAVGSLARTYTNTYLSNTNYTSLYIFNRLLTSTVTDGTNTATLASNSYDQNALVTQSGPNPTMPAPPPPPILLPGTVVTEHDNTNYSASFNYRGNVTTATTPTTTTTNFYDITGTAVETTVNGVTSASGTGSSTNYAAPTQVTTNTLTSNMSWSSFLGVTSATGPNGDTSSIGYDANARPTSVTSPYGATTTYTYNDTASPPNKIVTTDGHWVKTVMDGFGRTIQTVTGYGSTTVSTVDTQYAPCGCSPLGKLSQQSQPYAPGGSDAWTVYHYDASGRTTSSVLPDGSTTSYVYQGNTVKVTDPAGKWKTFTMDAFGNLTTVLESDPSLGNVTTNYTYDVLNHLTSVSMPRGSNTQTRTFNYNSGTTVTGFLQSATNPENGTVTYTYNANNLLASKTDAKSQNLTYQYDSYNRLSSVTWTNPPQGGSQVLRTYYYDTNPLDTTGFSQYTAGRLAAVKYAGVGTAGAVQINEMYSYTQPFGNVYPQVYGGGLPSAKRVQVNQPMKYQNVQGQNENANVTGNLDTTFTYNAEGGLISTTYPTVTVNNGNGTITNTPGPTYNYSYDSMYRLSGMTQSTTTIVSGVSYNAANQLLGMTFNGTAETRSYNVLNQLTNVTAGSAENLTYSYPTGANNGKASSMYNAVSGETVTYTYDSLNRLLTASGSGWGEQYGFDPFGNLLSKTVTSGSGPSMSISVNTANNQIEGLYGVTYDANGNTTGNYNGGVANTLTYDAENRVSTYQPYIGSATTYSYDAQNRRIWIWPGTTDTWGNVSGYTVNIYTPSGLKLGAYAVNPSVIDYEGAATPFMAVQLTTSDQYFGSRRLAVIDQLGSAGTYFPWGENRGTTNPLNTWSFGTYWEDSVSSLDYANNRYYSNAYGRFMTPDPSMKSAHLTDPQSWNRYPYVGGDPVNHNDPSGLTTCDENGDNCFDGVTVNGDTGDVTWFDVYWPVGGNYWDQQYNTIMQQWAAFSNEIAQANALANGCPFGETRMSNGTCDIAINQAAQQVFTFIDNMNPQGFINTFGAAMVAGVGSAVMAGATATALADASWALATNGNTIVLGSFPGYLALANQLGANALNIPMSQWSEMTPAQQWAENVAFLNAAIANASDIILSTNVAAAQAGTAFYNEIQYLLSQGCTVGPNGWSIICH